MNDSKPSGEKLRRLQQRYARNLPALFDEIDQRWNGVVDSYWGVKPLEELLHAVHRIAGSSASYGYQQINTNARMVEATLREILDNPIGATSELQERLERQREMLQASFQEDQQPVLIQLQEQDDNETLRDVRANQMIYLVEDDSFQAEEIAEQISYFGYTVKIYTTLDELIQAVKSHPPRALLMDVIFPEGFTAGPEAMAKLQTELEFLPPVIYISESGSLKSRLEAVRAYGEAYFTKPVDISLLVEVLDQLTVEENQESYRVLVVDDSPLQANERAEQLQASGMQTYILHNPFEIMGPLETFQPNIILLDTYMSGCTGPELAKVIRQIEEYVITPIIYLSSEDDRDKQLDVLVSDSEDFIPKSIGAERLKSIVRSRIDRFRQLRSLMVRDSLTGLYNHSTIKERLEQELSRASRQQSPLSFAMIDLDHFKRVNDTHGHGTGDRVLKSLARYLSQRLRKSDVIGRYGGEEFAIILPDTPLEPAVGLLNELRQGFAHIHHRGSGKDFTVKLSAGLACYPDHQSPIALIEAADQALYLAKRQGRNQVVVAEHS